MIPEETRQLPVRTHSLRFVSVWLVACEQGTNEAYPVADLNTILEERDACGVGIIANLANDASHKTIQKALMALGCMEHRGGCSADNDSGDGAGILCQVRRSLCVMLRTTCHPVLFTPTAHKCCVGRRIRGV